MLSQKHKPHHLKRLLSLLVFLAGTVILGILNYISIVNNRERIRAVAEMNAVTYADWIIEDLNRGISVTETLKQVLISANGSVNHFETIAAKLMTDYFQSIQLAPGGVVTEIYPEKGNEAGKIDLLHDELRGEVCRYGMENEIVTMQGPFSLQQGGQGLAIRNPVFLEDENGHKTFWGFTVVVIRVPEIFSESLQALSDFGYDYCLSKITYPINTDYKEVYCSGTELKNPVSYTFDIGNCHWKLEVMPSDGWNHGNYTWVICLCGFIILVLLTAVTIMFVVMDELRKKYRRLAITDPLTGLLNRSGFDERAEEYLADNRDSPCVGIILDIDDFKFVNDMYGHYAGDNALKNLAQSLWNTFPENSILGRNGGDEFCLILPNCTADDVRARIEAFVAMPHTFPHARGTHNCSVSLGYAEYPTNAANISDLLARSDMALYAAKLHGKRGCTAYREDLHPERRTQLGFALNDVSENLPSAFLIYKADKKDDTLLFANSEMVRFAGCNDLDDFMHFTHRHFGNLIHPSERTAVEDSIWRQIDSGSDGSNDYVRFRFATKDGSYKTVLDHGRMVDSSYYGKVFYVIIVSEKFIKKHYREDDASSPNP